jgi:hypothetical protein
MSRDAKILIIVFIAGALFGKGVTLLQIYLAMH